MGALLGNELGFLSDELFNGDLLVETYRLVDMNALETVDYQHCESLINAVRDIKSKHCASITDIRYNYDERSLAVVVLYDDTKLQDMCILDMLEYLEPDAEYNLRINNSEKYYSIDVGKICVNLSGKTFEYYFPEPEDWDEPIIIDFLSEDKAKEFFTGIKIAEFSDNIIYLNYDPEKWFNMDWFHMEEQKDYRRFVIEELEQQKRKIK